MTPKDVKSQKCSNKTIYSTYNTSLNGQIYTSYAWTTKKSRQTYIPPAGQTTLTIYPPTACEGLNTSLKERDCSFQTKKSRSDSSQCNYQTLLIVLLTGEN